MKLWLNGRPTDTATWTADQIEAFREQLAADQLRLMHELETAIHHPDVRQAALILYGRDCDRRMYTDRDALVSHASWRLDDLRRGDRFAAARELGLDLT